MLFLDEYKHFTPSRVSKPCNIWHPDHIKKWKCWKICWDVIVHGLSNIYCFYIILPNSTCIWYRLYFFMGQIYLPSLTVLDRKNSRDCPYDHGEANCPIKLCAVHFLKWAESVYLIVKYERDFLEMWCFRLFLVEYSNISESHH